MQFPQDFNRQEFISTSWHKGLGKSRGQVQGLTVGKVHVQHCGLLRLNLSDVIKAVPDIKRFRKQAEVS